MSTAAAIATPRELPILFSREMVRAILTGRKTQTRRVIIHQPPDGVAPIRVERFTPIVVRRGQEEPGAEIFGAYDIEGEWGATCPYGQPGDRLWVKETWMAWDRVSYEANEWEPRTRERRNGLTHNEYRHERGHPEAIEYRADDTSAGPWESALLMPRWASRITLEVTGVRVERLQDISEKDAIAEGISGPHDVGFPAYHLPGDSKPRYSRAAAAFEDLWNSINDARGFGWDANPWVWVVEFRRV